MSISLRLPSITIKGTSFLILLSYRMHYRNSLRKIVGNIIGGHTIGRRVFDVTRGTNQWLSIETFFLILEHGSRNVSQTSPVDGRDFY